MPRMKILNSAEQEAFDSPPLFNHAQRNLYFDFPLRISQLSESLRTTTNRLCFLLSSGYFKATKRFFQPSTFHLTDIKHVAIQAGFTLADIDTSEYARQNISRHQELIREFYGFTAFDQQAQLLIGEEIVAMAQSHLKPRLIFWSCIDILIQKKVEVPGYFRLAELILSSINHNKQRLNTIIAKELTEDTRKLLDALFEKSHSLDGEPVLTKTTAYRLTLLKKLSQSTNPSKIKQRVEDFELLQELYECIQPVLKTLKLSHDGIHYYATSVIKSEIFQIARRVAEDRYLHLIAFIAFQYYRLQDNLISTLLSCLQSYQNGAQREHRDQCYAQRGKHKQSMKTLLDICTENLLGVLKKIRSITLGGELSDTEKIERIFMLLEIKDANPTLSAESELEALKIELEKELDDNDYYNVLEQKSIRIQNRISPIIKTLIFQAESGGKEILEAIQYFKKKTGNLDKNAPLDFLKPVERHAVMEDGQKFRISLYKALLFLHVQNAIKSGTLNLVHSYKYRPLDDYLIDRARWKHDKENLLLRADMKELADPVMVLKNLDEKLLQQYFSTNRPWSSFRPCCNFVQ